MDLAGSDSNLHLAIQTKVIDKILRRCFKKDLQDLYSSGALFLHCCTVRLFVGTVEEQACAVPIEDLQKCNVISFVRSAVQSADCNQLTVIVVNSWMKSCWHLSIWHCGIWKMCRPSH